jgi:protoheme ferro-lyase
MEKTIPSFPFTVAAEEKEEIKLQYQEIWHGKTLTLITRSTRKNLLKTMDTNSLHPPARCRRRKERDQRWWTIGRRRRRQR